MPKARNINWENLMGALKRLPDSDLSELLTASKAKLEAIGIDPACGKVSKRMGGDNLGDNYNHRSVLQWIDSAVFGSGRIPKSIDETTSADAITRFHLVNLYATLVARGVKPSKPKESLT